MTASRPGFESREPDWLTVDDARARVQARAREMRLDTERVLPLRALGRALAADVRARATLPSRDNSAMDGYAVRSADVRGASADAPVRLRLVGVTHAGQPPGSVGPGEAVRVMTGGAVADGADGVVRVEHTDREAGQAGRVVVFSDADAGRHVRPAGEDVRAGDVVLHAGDTVTPARVGVLHALGAAEVEVRRRPVVAVLSTGDELRDLSRYDDVVDGHGVPESNGPMLLSAVADAGGEPLPLGVAPDREEALEAHLRAALEADLLVVSGGASMGEADLVKRVLERMGFELDFWRVRMRPGSPVALGRLPRGKWAARDAAAPPLPVLSLPGNPASAFVTWELFGRPFVLTLAGHRGVERRRVGGRTTEALPRSERLVHFHRVTVGPPDGADGRCPVRPTGSQTSGLVQSLAVADGLAVVLPGEGALPPGSPLEVILLDAPPALGGRRA